MSFGSAYAAAYDSLYRDKDYQGEVRSLEEIFRSYSSRPTKSILDLGCGTGNHAFPLANCGYEVLGVDRSEKMLDGFRKKMTRNSARPVSCHLSDVCHVDLRRSFDAVVMLFAVLSYQLSNAAVTQALRNVRRHLSPGGLFIADFWFGPAVLREGPARRQKTVQTGHGELVRDASGTLDILSQTCTVDYVLRGRSKEGDPLEAAERHMMRYFFPKELELFLEHSSLRLLRLGCFPEIGRDPDQSTWTAALVARADE